MNAGCVVMGTAVAAIALLLCAGGPPAGSNGDIEVVHVNVDVTSSGDAALAALAAVRGKQVIADKTMVTTEKRAGGYVVQLFELSKLPASNPVDPAQYGRVTARIRVAGDGLMLETLRPRSGVSAVREDDFLAALTFLAATGRAPDGAFFMDATESEEGTHVNITRVPLTPGAYTQVVVSGERIIVRPGA